MSDFKNIGFYCCLMASFSLNYWVFSQEYLLKTLPQSLPRSINISWVAPLASSKFSKSMSASKSSSVTTSATRSTALVSSAPKIVQEVIKAKPEIRAKKKHTVFPARPQVFHRVDIDWKQLEQKSIAQKTTSQPQRPPQITQKTEQKESIHREPTSNLKLASNAVANARSEPMVEVKSEAQRLEELRQKVNSYLKNISVQSYYPRRALSRGWEGTVQLVLQFEETGKLSSFSVSKRSDFKILDRAALKMIEQHQELLSQYVQQSSWESASSKRNYILVSPISFTIAE